MNVYLLNHGDDEPNLGGCSLLRGVYATRDRAIEAVPDSNDYLTHSLRTDDYDYVHCCWIDEQEVVS